MKANGGRKARKGSSDSKAGKLEKFLEFQPEDPCQNKHASVRGPDSHLEETILSGHLLSFDIGD